MSDKKIHIEKYDFDAFEKEQKPFVMILTDVIQKLTMKNSQAFLIWAYLESLPPTWIPNKQHLMQHFEISERTYERHMGWLNTVGLIEYRQNRSATGEFSKGRLVVLSGSKFNPDAECLGSVKIDGTEVYKKKTKVIHISEVNRVAKNGGTDEPSTTRTSTGENGNSPNRQKTEPRLNDGHINTTIKTNKGNKKTNNHSVSVFSDFLSVKTHIDLVIANRNVFVEEQMIAQGIYYAFETNPDKSFDSVNKRINIFLKKVREGKWLIPQGFKGITSQSIREQEETLRAQKQKQYKEEANAFKAINKALSQGEGLKGFRTFYQKLKSEVCGHAHEGTMQATY